MDRREVNLKPDEVERALEELFGFSDGARSEDEAEDSDVEDFSGPSNENVMQLPPPRSSRHSPSLIEHELQEDFDP
ncbi:unnamed protein product [Parnassius apollo]|uniref:(apollo) hypothetical protein n=1 Tax=Parnassius apollo TaxID=110799 RepID=A0A8S3XY40_PARAO|nr:unnamed protein product [Parnassius apollo]